MKSYGKYISRALAGFLAASLALVFLSGTTFSQVDKDNEAARLAKQSLESYVANFLNESNYASYGFKSLAEARSASIAQPYKVMFIQLNDLKGYHPETSMKILLTDAKTLWFPVVAGEQVRTKLEIVEKAGQWVAGSFGGVRKVQDVSMVLGKLQELLAEKNITTPYNVGLVKIPALYAMLVSVEDAAGKYYFIPAMAQPQRFKIENGKVYEPRALFMVLSEFAKEIDPEKIH